MDFCHDVYSLHLRAFVPSRPRGAKGEGSAPGGGAGSAEWASLCSGQRGLEEGEPCIFGSLCSWLRWVNSRGGGIWLASFPRASLLLMRTCDAPAHALPLPKQKPPVAPNHPSEKPVDGIITAQASIVFPFQVGKLRHRGQNDEAGATEGVRIRARNRNPCPFIFRSPFFSLTTAAPSVLVFLSLL